MGGTFLYVEFLMYIRSNFMSCRWGSNSTKRLSLRPDDLEEGAKVVDIELSGSPSATLPSPHRSDDGNGEDAEEGSQPLSMSALGLSDM